MPSIPQTIQRTKFFDKAKADAGLGPGSPMNQLQGYIGAGQNAGFFDPNGSPVLRAQRRRSAVRNARNRRRRGQNAASLYGLDANQTRAGLFGLDRENSGMVANDLNQGEFNAGLGQQDYFRSLYGGQLDFDRQMAIERMRAKAAKDAQPSFLGKVAGAAVGAGLNYATGGGYGAAKKVAGGGGGGGGLMYPNEPWLGY